MAPHVDLSKRTPGDARASTRTFLLYLANPGDASAVQRRARAWPCARGAAATHHAVRHEHIAVASVVNSHAPARSDARRGAQGDVEVGAEGAGGETVLLEREGATDETSGEVLARVRPERGRLLVFPHVCPHAGKTVVRPPKLLLRGEIY
jgi:hypothetical protein